MRLWLVAFALTTLALAGCGSDASVVGDVPRFDPRDAVVEEGYDAAGFDGPGRFDVSPSIDVTPAGDVAAPSDAGPPGDANAACQEVSEDYAEAVRAAQTCRVDGECGARVCETLCCACEVFVNAAAVEYAGLDALRERWTALGCATMGRCAGGGCGAAVSVSCSAEGRCLTVRERPTDGGLVDAATSGDATGEGTHADASMDATSSR